MDAVMKGLEGVVAAETRICFIDGVNGKLLYRGYDIHDLATHSNFEEVCYLLLFGKLPTVDELADFSVELRLNRELPNEVMTLLKTFARRASPMDALRSTVSLLAHYDLLVNDNSPEANLKKAISLIAKFPTIVATHERLRNGMREVKPEKKFDHAKNFLYMLWNKVPQKIEAKAFDLDFLLTAEHELNASTFAARVTAATLSDIYSAVTTAISTLKGPLHGGARSGSFQMFQKIGQPEAAEKFIREALARKEKIVGWGHRVYKTMDPRAVEFKKFAKKLSEHKREMKWFLIAEKIEQILLNEPHFMERKLFPNVDFYPGIVYELLKIPLELADPIFTIGRIPGWCAHILEQWSDNRLIRPVANYVGERNLVYTPIQNRR